MKGTRRERMASRRKGASKARIYRWSALFLIAVMAGTGIYIWHFTDLLMVKEIELRGGEELPVDSLSLVKEKYIGCNIFTIPLDNLRAGLMEYRDVAEVAFKRRIPNKVECFLKERKPVAAVLSGGIREVDAGGVVLSATIAAGDVDLPLITGVEDPGDEKGRAQIERALEVLSLLKERGFSPADQLSEINVAGEEILLVWLEAGSVIRLGDGEFEERIQKLKNVYGVLERQNSFPRLIDLRFNRQVVIR